MQAAAETVVRHGLSMRSKFNFKQYNLQNWFPGHMAKGLSKMQAKLKMVDCIIEVHDARIPFTGRNPLFVQSLGKIKPHILVMNKVDLILPSHKECIRNHYSSEGFNVIFTNCKDQKDLGLRAIYPRARDLIQESDRFNREEANDYSIMIIGIPNVGKSSLINALRAKYLKVGRASRVGPSPGVTKSVLEKIKINFDPLVYLYDTPGVLTPKIQDTETGLKLALANTIKDHLIRSFTIADFLLFKLNYAGNHKYVDHLDIPSATDDVNELLMNICIRHKLTQKLRPYGKTAIEDYPNMDAAAIKFIKGYRDKAYGVLELEDFDTYRQNS